MSALPCALSPKLHAGIGAGLTFDAGMPGALGHPRACADLGSSAGHYQGGAGLGGHGDSMELKTNPGHLQQKMLRHRQVSLERQRCAARNRLGASMVAQANPLCQPARSLQLPEWGAAAPDGPPSSRTTGSGDAAGPEAQKKEESATPLTSRSQGKAAGGSKQLEVVADCLAVEEIFDECIQAGPGIVVSPRLEERQQLVRDRHVGSMEPARPVAPTPGSLPKIPSPRGGDASEAWGGAAGLQRGHSRFAAVIVEDEVMDLFGSPSDRQADAQPRGGRRRLMPSSDADEEADAPADLDGGAGTESRRGRRWWKWQGGKAGQEQDEVRPGSRRVAASQEVTAVCNFSSADTGG